MTEGIDTRTSVEIKLDFPFTFDGEQITSLTMRRPKLRDTLAAQRAKGEMAQGIAMIVALIERPQELLEEVDEVDLKKLQDQYLAFTGRQDG